MEAMDERVLLFDRIKFLSIYSSNLEEFYRVRVSEHRNILEKEGATDENRRNAIETLDKINREVGKQLKEYNGLFHSQILPSLARQNIILYQEQPVFEFHKEFVRTYFLEEIFPYLQPVLLLKDEISSFLRDNRLYLFIRLYKKTGDGRVSRRAQYATMKIPFAKVPRFVQMPPQDGKHYLMFVDDIITENLDVVFPGFVVDSYYSIRISRDADFSVGNVGTTRLVDEILRNVKKRKIGAANRLVYDARMPQRMLRYFCDTFNIPADQCIAAGKYMTLEDLIKLPNPTDVKLSADVPIPMRVDELDRSTSLREVFERKDVLLYFPYQSFDYVVRFLMESAYDPNVKEIKVTQYRVAENSAVINALITAARNGKAVTVFVELKARFDEENNIETAERMRRAGIRIVYSQPGLKVHAKVALVLRHSEGGDPLKESFAYLSTGNFNEKTAKVYADMGLFTNKSLLIGEIDRLFRVLESNDMDAKFDHLLVAQFNMLPELKRKIAFEIAEAKAGRKAYMILKMNGLQDADMIHALYDASEAGVKVDLIVRGICCLMPQQEYSRNIRLIRIVDSFLEHARIWHFYAAGKNEVYLTSADWMKRNLSRRIETAFPILDEVVKQEILTILQYQLHDNTKACFIDKHLNNVYVKNDDGPMRSQQMTHRLLKEQQTDPVI